MAEICTVQTLPLSLGKPVHTDTDILSLREPDKRPSIERVLRELRKIQ